MSLIQVEKGDTVATKDGKTIRVLAVYYNGDALSKVEGIDDAEASPMRRPVFSSQIARVLKKKVVVDAPEAESVIPEGSIEKKAKKGDK